MAENAIARLAGSRPGIAEVPAGRNVRWHGACSREVVFQFETLPYFSRSLTLFDAGRPDGVSSAFAESVRYRDFFRAYAFGIPVIMTHPGVWGDSGRDPLVRRQFLIGVGCQGFAVSITRSVAYGGSEFAPESVARHVKRHGIPVWRGMPSSGDGDDIPRQSRSLSRIAPFKNRTVVRRISGAFR